MFSGVNFAAITAGFAVATKSALDYASGLQEVQNVVDVAFGEMADDINEWSKTTLKAFGLNELSSKRMAGRFMAMSNGMGIAAKNGLIMSKTLTQLAGDIASFYNVSIEEAEIALQAVYTGETETLKRYGIVITEVNLQEYARRRGIEKSITQMTQLEKVMLRYNYIMEVTSQAQGDFARTSGNWANQIRLLKEQFTQLIGVLGQGLIKVLTPVVQTMNEMLSALISIANAIAVSFGGQGIESTTANVSSQVDKIEDGAGGTAENLGDANTQAKALKKTLASFDELNILNSNTSTSGEIIGGLTNGLGATSYGEAVVETVDYDGNLSKLKSFFEECKLIISKWAESIPKLNLEFDSQKAIENLESIAKNVLNVIAGWGSFIISIGVEVSNDIKLGRLANDLLSVVDAVSNVASAFTDILAPALLDFYRNSGMSDIVQWFGEVLHEALGGIASALNTFADWLRSNKTEIQNFINKLAELSNILATIILQLADNTWKSFTTTIESMGKVLRGITFEELVNLVGTFGAIGAATTGVGLAMKTLSKYFGLVGKDAKDLILQLTVLKDYLSDIDTLFFVPKDKHTGFEKILVNIKSAIENLIKYLKGVPTAIKAPFAAIAAAFVALKTDMSGVEGIFGKVEVVISKLLGVFTKLWNVIKAHPFAAIVTVIAGAIDGIRRLLTDSENFRNAIAAIFKSISDAFSSMFDTLSRVLNNHIIPLFQTLLNTFKDTEGGLGKLWDVFSKVVGWMATLMTGTFTTVVVNTFVWLVETIANIIAPIADILNGLILFVDGVFSADLGQAGEGIKKMVKALFDAIINIGKSSINTLIRILNGALTGIGNAFNSVIDSINKLKVPDWVPAIGGKGVNLSRIQLRTIPYLANGGVIDKPTMAMVGEYAGASNNPEIVTPQKLLQEIISANNDNIVNALIQQTRQLLGALEGIDFSVSIGDDVIAQSAQRGNKAYQRRTGKPLFV